MKTLRFLVLAVLVALAPAVLTSCQTAPSQRVQAVQTLKAVGLAVDATMQLAAKLYHDGKLSAETWQKIAGIHDQQFQPAYNLAVQAVQSDLSPASPQLLELASQLAAALKPYLS